jgi:5-methylthioadenosine/S-adenosylhomocysteine deaminase
MKKLKIEVATAVTCNSAFDVIEQAVIHIEDGVITFIGSGQDAPPFEADETLGGEHIVALPGLINTHTHAAMTLLRGWADDMALEPWLQQKVWPFEANLTAADVVVGTEIALCEMLRGGTTTVADMYFHYETTVKTYIESGIRACPGAVLLGFLPEPQKRIERGIGFVRDYAGAGDGRITPFFAPHSLYTCDRAQWATIIGAAREQGALIHTHVAETRREVSDVTAQWGASPVRTLQNIGALEGPLQAAHCVHLDEDDWRIVEESAATDGNFRVSHNPTSNVKLASGFSDTARFLRTGVPLSIGTDGTASNNDLDSWEEMRLAAFLPKGVSGDPTVVSAREALQMATIGGARCLGLEAVTGSLEVGKRADIALVDFNKPHLYPRHNVVSHLVYAVKSSDVHATIVDGQVLFAGGQLRTLDEERICRDAQTTGARLAALAN